MQAGDRLPLNRAPDFYSIPEGKPCRALPWSARPDAWYAPSPIRFLAGPEYNELTGKAQQLLETTAWPIAPKSDRMGYRTSGPVLELKAPVEMVSTAVVSGTVQLLPDGQFIVLMADCQTTGGYPRIGQVINADIPRLAQLRPGERFRLEQVDMDTAIDAADKQARWLRRVTAGFYFNQKQYFV